METPAAERHLNDEEVPYGNAALGYIVTADFIAALTMPYCVGGNMGPGLKRSFDIILLCTVEAARSEYIYRKVNLMLTGKSISADHLKDVAQIYSHTQEKAAVTTFRPLDLNDYRKLYDDWKKKANVDLKVFREMAL